MHAVIEISWCATLYLDVSKGVTLEVLRRFYYAAQKLKFAAGTQGVFPLPEEKTSDAVAFTAILHCDQEDAKRICVEAGIESFSFIKVKTEEGVKKRARR